MGGFSLNNSRTKRERQREKERECNETDRLIDNDRRDRLTELQKDRWEDVNTIINKFHKKCSQ